MAEETCGHEQDPHRAVETPCHQMEFLVMEGLTRGELLDTLCRVLIYFLSIQDVPSVAHMGRIFGSSNGDLT